ncbi:site-specific DNA-methyltransferase [Brevibacterium linens]|uniref:site-specific DNA-methyltransferase n=1 Tax=Brevibacterium linens TaxID=1703 RepID=UPI000FCC944C|nr:DNA methyltransferase [Brevibacterium linens]AZU01152.1 site-specific DNA-methyltransferase [Brevibacterium linens]
MSRLTDLLKQVRSSDNQLGADLEKEIDALTKRRSFGLVFERHQPEAVELPHQAVRRGAKVRVLPPRGALNKANKRLWRVDSLYVDEFGRGVAKLIELTREHPERIEVVVEDLVVVAEFEDKIYPGLVETGRIERGGDKPFHTVINAENFHALEMLTYTHRSAIDAIYIDPPYNTGARDWKYNNDYVEGDDDYRHSKWLAFIERRLLVAKELLNPEDSVLVVTIDEKEYLRLGMLLEQIFPDADIQMVTAVIAPQGSARGRLFKRSEEYIFCVYFGEAAVSPLPLGREWGGTSTATVRGAIHWASLKRTGTGAQRSDREGMFYPVFLDETAKHFKGVGEPPGAGVSKENVPVPDGCVAIWPLRRDGSEGRWQVGPAALRSLISSGFARLGIAKGAETAISYLKAGEQKKVGVDYQVVGHREDGSIITGEGDAPEASFRPTTVWNLARHSAGHHGSNLIRNLLPGRSFPFPKSLYAVEDVLRFFVANKPSATVLDFFSGSGTTAHAVMRLNRQDHGRRQCISITNNEVAAEVQADLRSSGLRPGDEEWERLGICDFITKPRILAAITGRTPDGMSVKGDYKFTDEFAISDGLDENAAFFTLTYETRLSVRHNRSFERVAPILWMRAGSTGRIIDSIDERGWDLSEVYGVLVDLDAADEFLESLRMARAVRTIFVVTDDDAAFQMVCRELPADLNMIRLYESYLQNFELNQGRSH